MSDLNIFKNWSFEDCSELTDRKEILNKLSIAEAVHITELQDVNTMIKIGLIYHEVALNLNRFAPKKDRRTGYAEKSFQVLSKLVAKPILSKEIQIWILTYQASSLALLSGEKGSLILLSRAFSLFEIAIAKYDQESYLPRFLRASVSENLPWLFWRKRKFAKLDLDNLVKRIEDNPSAIPDKIKSFIYWAWANQFKNKINKRQVVKKHLRESIRLDPEKKAGFLNAEKLLIKLE